MRQLEKLSRRQRQATPRAFALYLLRLVEEEFGAPRVAVLWAAQDTVYWRFWHERRVEIWGTGRDANTYAGPFPVICHPPCGPWGKYRSRCLRSREDGVNAMRFVHLYGGVVEHPVGSSLFRECGTTGEVVRVNQGDFGHPALKPTLLYVVRRAGLRRGKDRLNP